MTDTESTRADPPWIMTVREPDDIREFRHAIVANIADKIATRRMAHELWEIEFHPFHNLNLLSVGNAKPHTDDGMAWTLLWVIQSDGHELHMRRQPAIPLLPGTILVFNPRRQHWTKNGSGTLILAAWDYGKRPDLTEVDAAMNAIRTARESHRSDGT